MTWLTKIIFIVNMNWNCIEKNSIEIMNKNSSIIIEIKLFCSIFKIFNIRKLNVYVKIKNKQ